MRWFRNLNLLPKLLLAGITSILIIMILQAASEKYFYSKYDRASESRRLSFLVHIGILKALRAEGSFLLNDVESGNFHETGKTANLDAYSETMSRVDHWISELSRNSTPEERADIVAMREFADTYRRTFLELVSDYRTYGTSQSSVKEAERIQLIAKLNRTADGIEMLADKQAERAIRAADQARKNLKTVTFIIFALTLPVALLIFYSIGRSISRPIEQLKDAAVQVGKGNLNTTIDVRTRDEIGVLATTVFEMAANLLKIIEGVQRAGIQVTSSSTQIAAAAKQLEAAVSEQAASTNEIVATAKEISATSSELAKTMSAITKVSEDTRILAEAGQAGLINIDATMQKLVQETKAIHQGLGVLNQKAGNINSIITTIAKVADQTNLLSLNAAIEAEKAGEHRSGFGVIASEIRRLADQTGTSTLEIERMVNEMQGAVSAGVQMIDQFSQQVRDGARKVQNIATQMATIIDQVRTLTPRFEEVSEGMQSQSLGAEQISDSMVQLSEGAQQTAEAVREFNMITEGLNAAAQALHQEVSVFRVTN
jgi:methyl-accepting chemotaxis protein